MTHPLTHLLLFVLWTLAILLLVLAGRGLLVLARRRPANGFPPYEYDAGRFLDRAARAYQNCLEMLPVLIALVLAAEIIEQSTMAGELTLWLLLARLAQSTVHLIGANHWLVLVRFTFFLVQVLLALCLAWMLLTSWWPY